MANFFVSCASGRNLLGCVTYRPSSIFNGVSVYSLQSSISNNCGTVKVGLLSARQTSASVKPKAGFTDWVCDDTVFSVKECSLGVRVGRLIRASSFKEVVVSDTFVKVDGMYNSCKNVDYLCLYRITFGNFNFQPLLSKYIYQNTVKVFLFKNIQHSE